MKNDDLIYEHILKPIQTDRRVWVVGGVALALILIVALWPSKTEVVKAVVKHEITESETYQALAKDLAETQETIKEKVDTAQQTFPERVEALTEKAVEIIDNAKRVGMDEELAFYDKLLTKKQLASMSSYASKTEEASAHDYAHLYSMAAPDDNTPNDIEVFFRKGVDYVMNDSDTPGMITEWEARWVSEVYHAKKGYIAKESLQGRKDQLRNMFSR